MNCQKVRGLKLLKNLLVPGKSIKIAGGCNPKKDHVRILKEIKEILKISPGVYVTAAKLKTDEFDGAFFKHAYSARLQNIQFMSFHVHFEKIDSVDIICCAVMIQGINIYNLGLRKVYTEMVQTPFD